MENKVMVGRPEVIISISILVEHREASDD